ncbi:hypothetical protein DICPUDRAFT_156844 [Dictyostelium purpureum]|uniref:tRNA/rRNA methyltransferase SpoU type domain-containing protein n=1 Tax=Dictyostelium purpureum TaxID=5786 RepID=F0ZXK8_DICPU|nr:uncharacterized protein DICPUDRAFT_156844 [Dictyostelium purpureum]EGC31314.1 hypothetical protein DICPUDRAFT_156844 [Dictyostelium purpureum]|eukprot:XP_003292158.1 hypothetical protein DICPUDRAFT_156844 [Dictyostelium purpureum]
MNEKLKLISTLKHYRNLKCLEYLQNLGNATNSFISVDRLKKFQTTLESRNKRFVIVCENLENQGNVSAIVRSADAMGIQHIYSITEEGIDQQFANCGRVSLGSENWLTQKKFKKTSTCIEYLKNKGYSIWVSDLSATSFSFDKLIFQPSKIIPQFDYFLNQTINNLEILNNNNKNEDLILKKDIIINEVYKSNNIDNKNLNNFIKNNEKIALVFGNETVGVSEEMKSLADRRFYLPMIGMVQSFNVSVSVAMTLAYLKMQGVLVGDLSTLQKNQLLCRWVLSSIQNNRLFLQQLNYDPDYVLDILNKEFD